MPKVPGCGVHGSPGFTWRSGMRSCPPSGCRPSAAIRPSSAPSCSASGTVPPQRRDHADSREVARPAPSDWERRCPLRRGTRRSACRRTLSAPWRRCRATAKELLHPEIAHQPAHLVLCQFGRRLHHLGGVIPHVHRDIGQGLVVQLALQRAGAGMAFDAPLGLEDFPAPGGRLAIRSSPASAWYPADCADRPAGRSVPAWSTAAT